jgi:[protein-PII] uridylyltransferase
MTTKDKIEELLYQNADDFKMAKVLKEDINSYFKTLDESFATSGGKDFLFKHTRKIDSILKLIYKIALRGMFKEYMPMKNSIPITITALGSYGREQLCVYSDIDLLIVYKDIAGYNIKETIEKILYLIWDSGLKLGHRVHHIDELLDVSRTDITIKTALLESRFLDGSRFLWTEAQNRLGDIRYDDPKSYIEAKLKEREDMHLKYPLSMEPNLKEGEGGFRDVNLVYWVGKIKYNITRIADLPDSIIKESDYRELRISLEFLFRVRSALHLASGKKEDKLRLDLIPPVASYLGYSSTQKDHMKFAKRVLTALRIVQLYSSIWLDTLAREYGIKIEETKSNLLPPMEQSNTKSLLQMIKVLNSSADREYEASPALLHQLIQTKRPHKVTTSYYPQIRSIFQQEYAHSTLMTLAKAHLLGYTIPMLEKVINLPQFDGYHRYSVHTHLLYSLYALEHIKDEYIKELYLNLTSKERELLKLVTFLHDGGKGRKRDHSSVGATLFRVYGSQLKLDKAMIDIGITLIQHHTLMSNIAQREDLYNEKTIFKFASYFKSKKMLDMIYILTYADMNGVGEEIYTTFTSRLLKTLYLQSIQTLEHDEMLSDTAKRVKKEDTLKRSDRFLALKRGLQKKILSIPSNLMFIRYRPEEIISIAQDASAIVDYKYAISSKNFLTIEIIRRDRLNLGYLLAKLSRLNLVNMDICKLFDEMKYFKIDFAEAIEAHEIVMIEEYIQQAFSSDKKLSLPTPHIEQKDIIIECDHSMSYAKMSLKTADQKGLLAYLITLFDTLGVDIASAKIHTQKNRVQDLFLIEKNGNFCNNKDKIRENMGVK